MLRTNFSSRSWGRWIFLMLLELFSGHLLSQDHSLWNTELSTFVDDKGRVNYDAWIKNTEGLDQYLMSLSEKAVESNWTKNQRLAYWINAYNAFTIRLILDHYPVSSITQIYDGKAWDEKWIDLGGKKYSLNDIEHEIIRPQFKEPRIHFAVNCAARSCPPLANMAFTAENLESLLQEQTVAFVRDQRFNQLAPQMVQISKIFEWYREDFGVLIEFLNKYSTTPIRSNAQIGFLEYDWDLNKK